MDSEEEKKGPAPMDGKTSKSISLEDLLELYKFALEEVAFLVISDTNGRITYANNSYYSETGFSREELSTLPGKLINTIHHSTEFCNHLWETLGKGEVWRGNLFFQKRNGEPFKAKTTIFSFPAAPQKPIQYLFVSTRYLPEGETLKKQEGQNGNMEPGDALFIALDENTSRNGKQGVSEGGSPYLAEQSQTGVNQYGNGSASVSDNSPQATQSNKNIAQPLMENLRILVAEDVEINRMVMQKHLNNLKYSYDFVSNGLSVLDRLQQNKYDLILMDMQMPVLNGPKTIQSIRSNTQSGYHNIPIIAITASIAGDAMTKCLQAGADDYLPKPFDLKDLSEKINALVSKKRNNIHMENSSGPTSTKGQQPLIDMEYLEQLSEGDKDFTNSMIQYFIDNTPEILASLRESYQQGDWKALRNIAHKFKPQLNFMGINSLLDDVEQLEEDAHKERNQDSFPAIIEKVERICLLAIEQLKMKLEEAAED